ncbi:Acyltransferase [Lysobacter dokdonensis DS-58]|uniref:Acyltransferase n=1 Tax=Lysobacter dokdonensis DS-58 TaxID=1300345 RepID=A0A0A2WMN3_9GAMM|nr:acyltransferase [Lysobacter dokdonensis]KGQ19992.1 Acyltransferase [Lysobacter dokdonensis DS-58]
MPASDQLRTLTSLRAFAAAAIVVFHLQGTLVAVTPRPVWATGVSFFFVLSGFVLTYAHARGALDMRRFYATRFARLWPLHLFSALAWLVVSQVGNATPFHWGWAETLDVLLLQAWVPLWGVVFAMNGVAWSISVEVFFYLLFPLLRGRWLAPIFIAGAIATAAILFAMDAFLAPAVPPYPTPAAGEFWSVHAALQFPVLRLLEFCLGVATAKLFLSRRIRPNTTMELCAIAGVLAFAFASEPLRVALADLGFSHVGLWLSQSGGLFVFAAAIFIFAHESGAISRVLRARTLVLLGDISFSTYMLHWVVLSAFLKFGRPEGIAPWLWVAMFVLAVYAASYFAWRFIELPSKRWILARAARKDAAPSLA